MVSLEPSIMSASIPGKRELPESRYDLGTYWGRVQHTLEITDPRYAQLDWARLDYQRESRIRKG